MFEPDHVARDANERDDAVGQLEPLHLDQAEAATEKLRHSSST
ncbi:MAG: hypothetical protein ACXU87_22210 [Xanthobacteraceae bacterium]